MEPVEHIGTSLEDILPIFKVGHRLADEWRKICRIVTLKEVANRRHIATDKCRGGVADDGDFILVAAAEDLDVAEALVVDNDPSAMLLRARLQSG